MATKTKRTPAITTALAHYEAALALLQQTLCDVDAETLREINRLYLVPDDRVIPDALHFMYAVHEAGDAFRAAKQVLDPNRALPSRAPKIA